MVSDSSWRPATVMPLLLELARALRARRFYLPGDPAQSVVLQRSSRVWTAALSRGVSLRLRANPDGFELGDGARVGGPGIKDVARLLHDAHVTDLEVLPNLDGEEFLRLVEVLAGREDAVMPTSGLGQALVTAGVRHVCLQEAEAAPSAPVREPAPVADDEPSVQEAPSAKPGQMPVEALEIEGEASDAHTVDRLIAQLDRSTDTEEYARIADELLVQLGDRMLEKDYVDAYRTALVLGRHCAGVGSKLPEVRVHASSTLQKLVLGSDELLRIAVQRAYTPATGSAVEAIQLLVALGSEVVPRLLEEHTRGSPEAQERTPSILVAMGDAALPVLVEELSASTPARIRRAAWLLGEMQHPRAKPALAEVLRSGAEDAVLREVARALASIGSRPAIGVLCKTLGERRGPRACAAAYGLGRATDPEALHTLCDLLREGGRQDPELRLQVVASLGRIGGPQAVEALADAFESARGWNRARVRTLRLAIVDALARIEGERARSLLESYSREGDPQIHEACVKALQAAH